AARLAAERALPADVTMLREHAERLRGAAALTDRRRADARLHIEIAATAQSPRLTREEMDLWSEIGDLVWLPMEGADVAPAARDQGPAGRGDGAQAPGGGGGDRGGAGGGGAARAVGSAPHPPLGMPPADDPAADGASP